MQFEINLNLNILRAAASGHLYSTGCRSGISTAQDAHRASLQYWVYTGNFYSTGCTSGISTAQDVHRAFLQHRITPGIFTAHDVHRASLKAQDVH
jgi:hypothetical protein